MLITYLRKFIVSIPRLAIVRTLLIKEDLQWQVYVGEHLVPAKNGVLVSFRKT